MSRTQRDPARLRRAAILTVEVEPLEHRTLLSFAAPVAITPGVTNSPGPTLHTPTPTLLWTAATSVTGLTGYRINLVNETTQRNFFFDVGAGTLVAGTGYAWNVSALVNGQSGPPGRDLFSVA